MRQVHVYRVTVHDGWDGSEYTAALCGSLDAAVWAAHLGGARFEPCGVDPGTWARFWCGGKPPRNQIEITRVPLEWETAEVLEP